jgi:hypothetical protein
MLTHAQLLETEEVMQVKAATKIQSLARGVAARTDLIRRYTLTYADVC